MPTSASIATRAHRRALAALGVVIAASCGGPPAPSIAPYPQDCALLPPQSNRADTITVALFDAVEPEYAPWAHNAGERVVFGLLYETLVAVDCLGEIRPALASSWKSGDGGRRWTFELRENARFWDGARVAAADVVASWQDALTLDTGVDSVSAAGEGIVDVCLREPQDRVPVALAAPAFAVAKRRAGLRWPLGTAPYDIAAPDGRGAILVRPSPGATGPIIRFVASGASDARDLLEGGADLVVTADPQAIEYAGGQPRFVTVALPWETTYVLLSTSRLRALRGGASPAALPAGLTDALARDAVRGDARGHEPPAWWDGIDRCATDRPPSPPAASPPDPRVLYDALDPVARDLAQRIVALAATDPAASADAASIAAALPGLGAGAAHLAARGVPHDAFARSLREGVEFAYVVPLPRLSMLPCHEARVLVRRAPWLAEIGHALSAALLPLVDTRAHAIVADCGVDLVVDGYGGIRIVGASPPRGEAP